MAKEKVKDPAELSVEEKLKNLYSLQTMLSEIDKIKTLRGELPLEVQDLEDEIEGLTTRIEKMTSEIESLKAEISERNAVINTNKANIERYKEQIDSVRNNREYDNLTKQIEYAELDNQLHEKKIGEAKALMAARTEEMATSNEQLGERRTDLEIKKSELDEIMEETHVEEDRLKDKAHQLELKIEPRLLTSFKRIRKGARNGLGIVYVQRDACGGCFNKIPPQRQMDIRMHKKIIVCEYCGRILIDPELAGVKMDTPVQEAEKKPARKRAIKKAATSKKTTDANDME
jgi:predicted  nucleic acid-binding Zn-ribbon protein